MPAVADRLAWMAGRSPVAEAPGPQAVDATEGHPMGPEAIVVALADALTALHAVEVKDCPYDASTSTLREIVDERLRHELIPVASSGPYAHRDPAELLALFDAAIAPLPLGPPVMVHGALTAECTWLDPAGAVTLTDWHRAGAGDRHLDLAATARMLHTLHGPALIAPFFDRYGLDEVDLRLLDAHQLLAHLLTT